MASELGGRAYQIELPFFQGPLELLLYLIERQELDITKVSLLQVTDQYLEQLRSRERIDPEALSDFLVIAAKLLLIKSLSLLPQPPPSAEPTEPDPGEELVQQLREYRRFKAAALALGERERAGYRSYPRLAPPLGPRAPALERMDLTLLLEALARALARNRLPPVEYIQPQAITIAQKLAEIEDALAESGEISFQGLVSSATSRHEVVVSFLALLELLRAGRIEVRQQGLFAEILIKALIQPSA